MGAYGTYGKVGPAPGFSWNEVRCTDGTLPTGLVFRRAVVKQARCLNTLRYRLAAKYGVPRENVSIAVNSWYRSPAYNGKIGGATKSQHLYGIATDVRLRIRLKTGRVVLLHPREVARFAAQLVPQFNSGGIGWYDEKHGFFTHLDGRSNGPARWVNG